MRLSSDSDDAGYQAWQDALCAGRNPKILLDGVEQTQCIMADDEMGLLTRCVLDDAGRAQIDPANEEDIWLETVSGVVEFEYP